MAVAQQRTVTHSIASNIGGTERVVSVSKGKATAWRYLGRFGLLLAIVGMVDVGMAWYPLGLGDPTWEFGAVNMSYTSLPLLTMGLAGLLAATLAEGGRWTLHLVGSLLILLGLVLLAAYVTLYLLNVPLALRLSPPAVEIGLKKAILKTSIMAVAFPFTYIAGGMAALRRAHPSLRLGSL